MHFILVDDDKMTLFFHDKLIRYTGLSTHIDSFHNPLDALDYICSSEEEIGADDEAILLIDLEMPEMSGLDFVEKLESTCPEVFDRLRIFIISASLDFTNSKRIESTPQVKGFFSKPLSVENLKKVVDGAD